MKARVVQIGNSRGIRIPKPLIEEAGLGSEVELRIGHGGIVILPARSLRSGWAEAARALRERDDDRLLDPPLPTRFDEEEWKW